MSILLTAGSYAQLISVLVIFVLVLGATAWVTRWMANYQKQMNVNCNIEVVETTRIAANKYVQLVRVGETYVAIAVCRDTVTRLAEVPAEQLRFPDASRSGMSFKDLLERTIKTDSGGQSESKDSDE
ncbi:MAG: flagellar biosynthetic protein FliO [Clostridium sp.]|nr:flagellar biosynthetic protein FliO [Acetatifactor muris]MCM1526003.1 flagellar biosynthetic protein FliO [Bacteroides sp.]MCM1562237.1 flagellar biosynthetic protein FliO [Clostridium sp.]